MASVSVDSVQWAWPDAKSRPYWRPASEMMLGKYTHQ